jgi:acyl carrier protein
MPSEQVFSVLREYIVGQVLDGKDVGLDRATPLLEWGVLNSLEVARLISFIKAQFGVLVPSDRVVADNFKNLDVLTSVVVELRGV